MPLHRIELSGLDAANLLGYLAALGTLRTLAQEQGPGAAVRLRWTEEPGWWMPVLEHPVCESAEQLVEVLFEALSREVNPAWEIGEDLTIPLEEFAQISRRYALRSVEEAPARRAVEFLAAFGSDGCASSGKAELIADTEFRTMSGAGHQHFLGFFKELRASTTREQLGAALFETWTYEDPKPSMRWDPNDYRPHALRADDPSKDPIKTMRGANRLAIEALPLFPTMPAVGGVLLTTGFDRSNSIRYPVWEGAVDVESARSLLAMEDVAEGGGERRGLVQRGVLQVYRSSRFTDGKYRNFSPSVPLL